MPQADVVFDALALPIGGSVGGGNGASAAVGQLEVIVSDLAAQGGMLVNMDTGEPWNPSDFKLTTQEGFKLDNVLSLFTIDSPAVGNRSNTVRYGVAAIFSTAVLAWMANSFADDVAASI